MKHGFRPRRTPLPMSPSTKSLVHYLQGFSGVVVVNGAQLPCIFNPPDLTKEALCNSKGCSWQESVELAIEFKHIDWGTLNRLFRAREMLDLFKAQPWRGN